MTILGTQEKRMEISICKPSGFLEKKKKKIILNKEFNLYQVVSSLCLFEDALSKFLRQ